MKTYAAPWGRALKIISVLSTVLLLATVLILILSQRSTQPWIGILPLVILVGGALFTVRGYRLTSDMLLVQRLLWETQVPLTGLQSVEFLPDAMARSIRTFGNGGLYSFTGRYRNQALGSYRAYVTDRHRTVALRFPDKTVVFSPGDPESFVAELKSMKGLSCPNDPCPAAATRQAKAKPNSAVRQ